MNNFKRCFVYSLLNKIEIQSMCGVYFLTVFDPTVGYLKVLQEMKFSLKLFKGLFWLI